MNLHWLGKKVHVSGEEVVAGWLGRWPFDSTQHPERAASVVCSTGRISLAKGRTMSSPDGGEVEWRWVTRSGPWLGRERPFLCTSWGRVSDGISTEKSG